MSKPLLAEGQEKKKKKRCNCPTLHVRETLLPDALQTPFKVGTEVLLCYTKACPLNIPCLARCRKELKFHKVSHPHDIFRPFLKAD